MITMGSGSFGYEVSRCADTFKIGFGRDEGGGGGWIDRSGVADTVVPVEDESCGATWGAHGLGIIGAVLGDMVIIKFLWQNLIIDFAFAEEAL